MCGLVGTAGTTPIDDRAWLSVGRDTMSHRGPDDAGEWWSPDRRVGLAHRRLSIIDLSPTGHQPMCYGQSLTVVFNGEIYNFQDLRSELTAVGMQFRSESDTEVILAAYRAWGTGCLDRLNGAFAFALYDAANQTLLLARDRAGEKPLFYNRSGTTLRFASELKALLADPTVPRRVDRDALEMFLAVGYVAGERCILEGFQKLLPGHALQFNTLTGESHTWPYWTLPMAESDVANEGKLLDELEALLSDSVQRQMIANVPVGILLSGGIDSSLITAMAVRTAQHVQTFTVRFPGHAELDETEHARLIAKHFGTEHIELTAKPDADLLPRLAHQFDEPVADSSMIATFLVSDVVRQHCTVALGGDGGDELFGGYDHHRRLLWRNKYLEGIPHPLRTSVSRAAERLLPIGLKGRNWLQSLDRDLISGLPVTAAFFDGTSRTRLVGKCAPHLKGLGTWIPDSATDGGRDLLDRALRNDFRNYLAEDILVKVDRASMLASLETRAPFLDHRIIELAFRHVPSRLKATPGEGKWLLKQLTRRALPEGFDRNRKQGFSIPLADWLREGSFRNLFHDVLLDGQAQWLDRPFVASLLDSLDKGRAVADRLFCLVILELWRRDYRVSF